MKVAVTTALGRDEGRLEAKSSYCWRKDGRDHLTYGQGAAAEIAVADYHGLPVSTTYVLSSGVAGTMMANKSGLQLETVRNIGWRGF